MLTIILFVSQYFLFYFHFLFNEWLLLRLDRIEGKTKWKPSLNPHLDTVVLRVVHHSAGQGVEADKVSESARMIRILHNKTLDDVLLRNEPVQHISLK